MQLVEQLQFKKQDATRLLSSRKRKLAELYSVTAYTGDHLDPKSKDSYFTLLQHFQDANNLEKGHLFNESTLPHRRPITRTTRAQEALANAQNSKSSLPDRKASNSPLKSVATSTNKASDLPLSRVQSPRPVVPVPNGASLPQSATHDGVQQEIRVGNQLESRGSTQSDASGITQPDQPNGATLAVPTSLQLVKQPTPERPSPQPASIPTLRKLSPALPIPHDSHEAQSSPASTNGPASSNTPAPDALSPTTSPGDDIPPPSEVLHDQNKEASLSMDEPKTPEIEMRPPVHKMSISSIDVDMIDLDPSTAFDSPVQPSVTKSSSPKKEIPERKPPIRVNTQSDNKSYFEPRIASGLVETPAPVTAAVTPAQTPSITPGVESARRATRIQSGALQKKSVSEILGETPRSASPHLDSPLSPAARAAEKERKERERSKLSTVVFAKPTRAVPDNESMETTKSDLKLEKTSNLEEQDYMYTLFESKAQSQSRQGSLSYLLQHSHKALSTADHVVELNYQHSCRVLKRLYQLQNLDKWALRQRKRADEPPRPTSHWDFLLDHAKWMRTDFREERRWKLAAARALAEDCAEYVNASEEEKRMLRVIVRKQKRDHAMDLSEAAMPSPPGLDASGEDESVHEDIADPRDLNLAAAPAAVFSLGASDFTFATDRTPAFDKLLNELPLYQPAAIEPDLSKSNLAEMLDRRWKTPIVAVSKFATEKLKTVDEKPPIKRSRYDYDIEDEPSPKRPALEPRENDVALFMPENKHIRDRIHPGHSFRPPSEHPMPTQAFFETRQSSQWLNTDDDEVKKQAREFSFNWQLISDLMTPGTLYTSSQDRRSAWECFERWISLEGMPADMSKTPYFKTYSSRIENAQKKVQEQWEELERRNGTAPANMRKKTTLPLRVERKHNRRHLFMLDAMRKLAKKREALRQKAMQSADMAAVRKSNDAHAPRPGPKTPAEWSQVKFDREQKMAKQQELYRQQLIAHQRATQSQRGTGAATAAVQMPPTANGQVRMPAPNGMPVPGMPNGHMQIPHNQQRPHPNMMGVPQGMQMPMNMTGPKGVSTGQMSGMPRGMAGSPQQIKAQQEQLLRQAQAAQQNGQHSSPNVQHAGMANGQNMNNAAFMINQANGQASPGNTAPPRPGSSHMGQSLSSGSIPKINQLYANIKEQHPNMPDEEVNRIATQQLFTWKQQALAAASGQANNRPKVNQAAVNAAVGAANSGGNFSGAVQNTNGQPVPSFEQVQAYNARLRLQQSQAQQAVAARGGIPAPNMTHNMMSNNPGMNMARPASQHGQPQPATPNMHRPQPARPGSSTGVNMPNGQVNGVSGANNGQLQPPVQGPGQQTAQGQQASPRPATAPMQS